MFQHTLARVHPQLSPFPNVTLYYTVYKLWSNRNAAVGCSALKSAFKRLDEVQRILEEEERTDALKRKSRGLLGRWRLRASGAAPIMVDGPVPVFTASKELDRVVKPLERWVADADALCIMWGALLGI